MKCYIVTKEKKVKIIEVDGNGSYFTWNDGAYKLDGDSVKLTVKGGRINPEAELFYVEGVPFPVSFESTESNKTEDIKVLDEVVLKNALENLVSVKSNSLGGWFKKLASWISEPSHMLTVFMIIVVIVIVKGLLIGGGLV